MYLILDLSRLFASKNSTLNYDIACNFAEIVGDFLFNVVNEFDIPHKYGIQRLAKFAVEFYNDESNFWKLRNEDGYCDLFGIIISMMKFQNNENTNESQNENQSVNQSVDEEDDIIIEYNNYTLINSICNFFRYVKGKTPGEIPMDIASDIICCSEYCRY